MKIVKILRESGQVLNTSNLFQAKKDGIFLQLAENKESQIRLLGGLSLYYQRTYQFNTKSFHTYTQRMIPDIVIEGEKGIIIFDPKYRIPDNLGKALGEMHKYRDGIIQRDTGNTAVQEVYILTPTKAELAEGLRYFRKDFQQRYKMGAIQVVPGFVEDILKEKILTCIKSLRV